MSLIHECSLVLALACILDFLIGDPAYEFHPVRLIGNSISLIEKFLRNHSLSTVFGGFILFLFTTISALGTYLFLHFIDKHIHPYVVSVLNIYIVYSCFAYRDLINHIKPVITALKDGNMLFARQRVSRVVGRDVSQMKSAQVARAAIETVAENFIDGIFSPLFWFTLGALAGFFVMDSGCLMAVISMLFFKTVSTMDSMVGYRNEDYEKIGKVGARLDDMMNFLPARLSLIPLVLASIITGQNVFKGTKVFFRDRLKHLSPNSAHGESFIAGALNIRLGGPLYYKGQLVPKPWLGDDSEDVPPEKITTCCRLIFYATLISIVGTVVLVELLRSHFSA